MAMCLWLIPIPSYYREDLSSGNDKAVARPATWLRCYVMPPTKSLILPPSILTSFTTVHDKKFIPRLSLMFGELLFRDFVRQL